jgi:hypothetical protein
MSRRAGSVATSIIAGGVIAVALFAGIDALRSSSGKPPPAKANATEAVTTTQPETDAELLSSQLQTGRVVRLVPGRVTTNERFPITVTFTVPVGWYGYQDRSGFVIGKTASRPSAHARNVTFGGIALDVLDRRLPDLQRELETSPKLRLHHESPIPIGGYSGRQFGLDLRGPHVLRELLGVPGVFLDDPEEQVILLGVGSKTLLVHRRSNGGDPERFEVNEVLYSFRVITPEQVIERTGNRWARLFAAGQRCNRFMHQPACEWVDCEHVGGAAIEECTPVSSEVQRSFGGAVVEDIVIRRERAAARFSNGVTVRLEEKSGGTSWWIARVGAGREMLE